MKYEIEKDVKITKKTTCKKYPFEEMSIGDSFLAGKYSRLEMTKLSNAARNWSTKAEIGYKFKVRKTKDGKMRIWRIG